MSSNGTGSPRRTEGKETQMIDVCPDRTLGEIVNASPSTARDR